MHIYVCIYVYVSHIYEMHRYMHIYIHTYIYIHMHAYTYVARDKDRHTGSAAHQIFPVLPLSGTWKRCTSLRGDHMTGFGQWNVSEIDRSVPEGSFYSWYLLQDSCFPYTTDNKKQSRWTSRVVQWLRIRLPMQGTQVRSLVWEDPTCRGATKPVHRNYWACALEPTSHNYWAHVLQLLKPRTPRARAPQQEKPPQWEARAPQRRVAPARCNSRKPAQRQRPNTAKEKKKIQIMAVPSAWVLERWQHESESLENFGRTTRMSEK